MNEQNKSSELAKVLLDFLTKTEKERNELMSLLDKLEECRTAENKQEKLAEILAFCESKGMDTQYLKKHFLPDVNYFTTEKAASFHIQRSIAVDTR